MASIPKSTLALWGSAAVAGSMIGYYSPPFKFVRQYIESQHSKYHDGDDTTISSSPSRTSFIPESHPNPFESQKLSEFARKHPYFHQALHPSSSALLEHELFELSLVKSLMEDPRYSLSRAWAGPFYQSFPEVHGPGWRKGAVYTANTLHVPGGLATKPVVFTNESEGSAVIVLHVGHRVTGFPAIVHGGVLATLLDETLARTAFLTLPGQTGVTANLTLRYKNPTLAHQFLVIRTETVAAEGRKVKVKGIVETLKGKKLVEADALFVAPKTLKLKKFEL